MVGFGGTFASVFGKRGRETTLILLSAPRRVRDEWKKPGKCVQKSVENEKAGQSLGRKSPVKVSTTVECFHGGEHPAETRGLPAHALTRKAYQERRRKLVKKGLTNNLPWERAIY